MQRDKYFYRQLNDDSNHLFLETTVRTVHVKSIDLTHSNLRKILSHSLNLDLYWSPRERDNRQNNQKDHKLKARKNKHQNLDNFESSNFNFDDQKWNSYSYERDLSRKMKSEFHQKSYLSINQAVNEERAEEVQNNVSFEKFDYHSNQNREDWI